MNLFQNKILNVIIKILIVGFLFASIYFQLFHKNNLPEIVSGIRADFTAANYGLLFFVLLLMLLNWGIEAIKWQLLVSKLQTIDFFTAVRSVICGVTLGTFTPNRMGEYGGRILYLKRTNRIKGIIITMVGSFAQIIVTVFTGVIGFVIFIFHYSNLHLTGNQDDLLLKWILFVMSFVLLVLFLFIYFNVSLFKNLFEHSKVFRRVKRYINVVTSYSYSNLLRLLTLSFVRYGVFSLQYLLLLWMFHVDVGILSGAVMICLIFFTQTIIPSITLAEMGIRGSVSLFFLSFLSDNHIGILSASLFLWFINLIIPALIGAMLLARRNIVEDLSASE